MQPAVAEGGDVGVLVSVAEFGEGAVADLPAAVGFVRVGLAEGLVRALEGGVERLAHLLALVVGPVATFGAGLFHLVVPGDGSVLAGLVEGGKGRAGGVVLGLGDPGVDLPSYDLLQPLGGRRGLVPLQGAAAVAAEVESRAEGGQSLAGTLYRSLAGRGVLYGGDSRHGLEDDETSLLDHGGDEGVGIELDLEEFDM